METNDIQKQWEQDVADYGDNAYLWYKISIGYDSDSGFSDAVSNQDMINSIHFRNVIVRKEGFPFNLERAKAGDVVEFFIENEWHECESFDISANKKWVSIITKGAWGSGPIYRFIQELRMKYPPKATNESPKN